jgi:hypothetical protein
MFALSQLSLVTRQLSRVCISQQQQLIRPLAASQLAVRPFATNKKRTSSSSQHKKKSATSPFDTTTESRPVESASHQEWIKFQKSIAVEGFETGQVMTAKTGKKTRGGKARNKERLTEVEQKLAERQRLTESGGGQYPPLRYEDSETERLLAEAYEALPERGGKRGTRNLKRQKRRWFLVRKIHSKYKYHMANFQTRKMEKRKQRMVDVREVLEAAPDIRKADREYQAQVFQRWAATMTQGQGEDSTNGKRQQLQE